MKLTQIRTWCPNIGWSSTMAYIYMSIICSHSRNLPSLTFKRENRLLVSLCLFRFVLLFLVPCGSSRSPCFSRYRIIHQLEELVLKFLVSLVFGFHFFQANGCLSQSSCRNGITRRSLVIPTPNSFKDLRLLWWITSVSFVHVWS